MFTEKNANIWEVKGSLRQIKGIYKQFKGIGRLPIVKKTISWNLQLEVSAEHHRLCYSDLLIKFLVILYKRHFIVRCP